MIDSCLISWGKAILVNFPETEKVDGSNDWVTKPLWKSGGLQFLTFNKTGRRSKSQLVSTQSVNDHWLRDQHVTFCSSPKTILKK